MTFKDFVESCLEGKFGDNAAFISEDWSVEVLYDSPDQFEYHTDAEQSGITTVRNDKELEDLSQDLFGQASDQVEGYLD
jgi:hypothetical protein